MSVQPGLFMIMRRLERLESKLNPVVKVKQLRENVKIPTYARPGDAGMDLCACITEQLTIFPGQTVVIPTGLAIQLPEGFEAQVRSRSGLAVKGITVANSPGTVDQGYTGEVGVILHNTGSLYVVHPNDRIAQMVVASVAKARIEVVSELDATERGDGGFGSTGA